MNVIVKTALPIVTSAATAWIMKKTRLPGLATPIVSLAVGAAVAKAAQRFR
ncbi:hypothetical protein AB0F81_50960 [Actinoplanes sp. NPDC024001]|uniref:hypothetical protein n=1 Tax=Actinoplanes sp. NPDC024001 TaxID=3154598 RepID=UPI0033DFF0F3